VLLRMVVLAAGAALAFTLLTVAAVSASLADLKPPL